MMIVSSISTWNFHHFEGTLMNHNLSAEGLMEKENLSGTLLQPYFLTRNDINVLENHH